MIFVNLPVSRPCPLHRLLPGIGAGKDPQFCDDTASCMVFSETIYAMLMTHDKFGQFTPKTIAEPGPPARS